jgi:uroporphyrinogen-III synthase
MLRFEPVTAPDADDTTKYGAIIVTSANALRAMEGQLAGTGLLKLPLFAVGEHTASAARQLGFGEVISANGDAADLRERVLASVRAKQLKKTRALLYLAGADVARDLAAELGAHGFDVITRTTYRMIALSGLPREAREAFAANRIEAVLHYSQRSVRAFLDAVRSDGVEITALAVPQCCMSGNLASSLREAGATHVLVASSPDENALFTALERALRC